MGEVVTAAVISAGEQLRRVVERGATRLRAISEEQSRIRRAPGAWSPKEIIGHLIDSASNNHGRFVRAQQQEEMIFPGYDQNAWVAAGRYADLPWFDIVMLWERYNLLIAHVMDAVPDGERLRARARHNLHLIAFNAVDERTPTTLDYFMRDYVAHIEHHLRQALDPHNGPASGE